MIMDYLEFLQKMGKEIKTYTLPTGQVVYSVGKPNIKALVKTALAQLS